MNTTLPPFTSRELIAERLPTIFPEGTPDRNYCIRSTASALIFSMIYVGAVEGYGHYLGPVHAYRMNDVQATLTDDTSRLEYADQLNRRKHVVKGKRWYEDNSREAIRDESLREGLMEVGVAYALKEIATTSSKPRYALKSAFARLFDPNLMGDDLAEAIINFQKKHLSPSALARITLFKAGVTASKSGVLVTFPNKETRKLAPGLSSVISKAVVEQFAIRFLKVPSVLWLSESGNKVVARDDMLAKKIGLKVEADRDLPDLILVDLNAAEPLIVFVEVVATDGPISKRRQEALFALTDAAGFSRNQVAHVTAYHDRDSPSFKKTMPSLAWGSFAWFATEPENIIQLEDGSKQKHFLEHYL